MAYTKVGPFINESTPAINDTNLNTIESGIYNAHYSEIVSHTISEAINSSDLSKIHIIDSVSSVVLSLPAATIIGSWVEIHKLNSGDLTTTADGTDVINDSSAGGSVVNSTASQTWAVIRLVVVSSGVWRMSYSLGSWATT